MPYVFVGCGLMALHDFFNTDHSLFMRFKRLLDRIQFPAL